MEELRSNYKVINGVSPRDIAIIGVSAKMPSADNIEGFWHNIRNGRDCVGNFPKTRKKDINDYYKFFNENNNDLKYRRMAYLDEIDKFDYAFFNISPKEASLIDPNQRLFLETVWSAIEDAGYGGKKLFGSNTGVFVGYNNYNRSKKYLHLIREIDPNLVSLAAPGNIDAMIPGRIAYLLDLKGPNMLIDTACSSSLVAVDLACQEIRNKRCKIAIVGGIKIELLPLDQETDFTVNSSPQNKTRAFDNNSDGTAWGEGTIAMLLKPLDRALKDHDNIYAVIKGSAQNHDGRSMSIMAPNPLAQAKVIAEAWTDANIDLETIKYIEAHGTGTKLGDLIEIDGLTKVFRKYTSKKQFCAIGSVKTNIGHLDNTAGLAGVLKAVLTLKYKEIPPSIYCQDPSHQIDWKNSPVFVNTKLVKWENEKTPRRCGVSSFGASGTNCHIVLEEAPKAKEVKIRNKKQNIFTLSAKSRDALNTLIKNYLKFINSKRNLNLDNICYTANTGRGHYNYRMAIIAKDEDDLKRKLNKVIKCNYSQALIDNIYYGNFKVVSMNEESKAKDEITEEEIKEKNKAVSKIFREFHQLKKENKEILANISRLYTEGADVEWEELYKDKKYKKISLPTYPFERKRCWIEISTLLDKPDKENIYYQTKWIPRKLNNHQDITKQNVILVLKRNEKISNKIAMKLSASNQKIIEANIGSKYARINSNKYVISKSEKDYLKLFEEIKSRGISQILHLLTLTDNKEIKNIKELKKSQDNGVFSLFYLVKAIQRSNIDDNIDIILTSNCVDEVTRKEERLYPENATLFGLGKVIFWENINLRCRCIDMDNNTGIDQIISEIQSSSQVYKVAYRNNKRYIEILDKVNISSVKIKKVKIKNNGVYIITGGSGGIGLEISRYLASKNNIKLILMNRSKMPKKDKWDEIIKRNKDKKLCGKLISIREIEKEGTEVECISADVTKFADTDKVISRIRKKYGEVNGVIHCAGVHIKRDVKKRQNVKELAKVLSVKVFGTWIIDYLTKRDNLDFFVFFSSAITIIGGIGQGGYTAANTYLNSYSFFRNKKRKRTASINWAQWDNVGFTQEQKIDETKSLFKAITSQEAIKALESVLNRDISNIIIGRLNFKSDIFFLDEYLPFEFSSEINTEIEKKKGGFQKDTKIEDKIFKIEIKGGGNNFHTETEKKIAQIWCEALGYQEININDNFFEIGGDSLFGIKIMNTINKRLNFNFRINYLFEYPTVKKLAQKIKEQLINEQLYKS